MSERRERRERWRRRLAIAGEATDATATVLQVVGTVGVLLLLATPVTSAGKTPDARVSPPSPDGHDYAVVALGPDPDSGVGEMPTDLAPSLLAIRFADARRLWTLRCLPRSPDGGTEEIEVRGVSATGESTWEAPLTGQDTSRVVRGPVVCVTTEYEQPDELGGVVFTSTFQSARGDAWPGTEQAYRNPSARNPAPADARRPALGWPETCARLNDYVRASGRSHGGSVC